MIKKKVNTTATKKRRSNRKLPELLLVEEPKLLFGYDQDTEDPRDGLTLFGPLEKGKPYGIRYGVVGTAEGVKYFCNWLVKAQLPIGDPADVGRPTYPGFEAAFGIPWEPEPTYEERIPHEELQRRLRFDDGHHRVFKVVELYEEAVLKVHTTEEMPVDIWFVVVPDDVYSKCRPKSTVSAEDKIDSKEGFTKKDVRSAAKGQRYLFQNELAEELAKAYEFEVNFHNQLKARLLKRQIVTQIIRESTIAHEDVLGANGQPLRDLTKVQQDIAWHLATATFYKAGGRPWKISGMRKGVCYLGIVFKHVDLVRDPHMACCAAQMFLNSGDGIVFKGNNGPWYTGRRGDFHVDQESARELVRKAIDCYKTKDPEGNAPKELFIHAKTKFNDSEWQGFVSAAGQQTNVVTVQIQEEYDLKLFRPGRNPVLRGTAVCIDENLCYLWTRGLVPRLRTYVGREVPNPLCVKICRGKAAIGTVLADILGLTKLNYNACRYGDGEPVTLKFANAVGEILTAGPVFEGDVPPLPFKHYV